MRDYQYGLSAVGIQNLLPSTKWMARSFARSNKLPYALIHLRDGTTAIVLGPKVAKKKSKPAAPVTESASTAPRRAVVMFHGGGYMGPALGQHIHLACGFAKSLPENVYVYILQYGLANEQANHYPRQLQQAAVLLDYLLTAEKYAPSAITLVGDSAGGHLALSLLQHLAHPDPQVPTVTLPEGERLAGAALLSPWIITRARSEGLVRANEPKDVLHAAALDYWAQNYLGPAVEIEGKNKEAEADKGTPWSCPLTTPEGWLAELPVDDMFVTYGEDEVLCGNVAQFCTALYRERKPVPAFKTSAKGYANEMHVHMVMNRFLKLGEPCLSEEEFKAWYAAQMEAPLPSPPSQAATPPSPPSSQDAIEPASNN